MLFDLNAIAPLVLAALPRAAAALADAAASTVPGALTTWDAIFRISLTARLGVPLPPEGEIVEPDTLVSSRLLFERDVWPRMTSAELGGTRTQARAWLDLRDAMAASADVEINEFRVPAARWVEQKRRLFGSVFGLAEMAALASRRPGLGGALWAASVLSRERRHEGIADLAALREHGVSRLLAGDPLSRDERTDIPSLEARFGGGPVEAGVRGVQVPCELGNPTGLPGPYLPAIARADMTVTVASRGAHMSRLQEAAHAVMGGRYATLVDLAQAITVEIARTHPALGIGVSISASTVVPHTSQVTRRRSSVVVEHVASIRSSSGRTIASLGLGVGVMTACPCTLQFSRLLMERQVGGRLPTEVLDQLPPTFTHSQPGVLTLGAAGDPGALPPVWDIWRSLLASAHVRQAVLKRPDEHQLVEAAHRRPQFCEDLVRDAAVELASRCSDADVEITADAALDESIHPHRAVARIAASARSLWAAP